MRVEAQVRSAPAAGPALAADRTPVQDHEVAGLDLGDAVADRLEAAGLAVELIGCDIDPAAAAAIAKPCFPLDRLAM